MTPRRALLRWHVWAGVSIGLFWAIQGLTGALLAFNRDIQAAMLAPAGGGVGAGARVPLDRLIVLAERQIGAPVTRFETFGPDPDLLLAYYDAGHGERTGVIDARSGALRERRDPASWLPHGGGAWGWILRVHEALLGGDSGQIVVGLSGSLLLASLAVGLWNALPYRRWRDARRMTRLAAPRARLAGWHRLIGLAAAPALLVMASCGVYLAFAPQLRGGLAAVAGYRPAYKPRAQAGAPLATVSAEQAYAIARRHFPGATLVRLVLPTARSPVYLFRLLQPDDARRWAGTSTIAIDPARGAIVDAYDSRRGPIANRLTDAIYSIHTGDVAGPIGRALVALAGLSLPAFAITGWLGWVRSRRKRGAR